MNCAVCSTPLPGETRFCPECGTDSTNPGSNPDPDSAYYLAQRLKAAVGDRYEVKEQLGEGGMGAVFLASERKLNRLVAIKILPPKLSTDPMFVARFEREAQNAAALDHPNIIPVYAVEEEEGLHYFVMKFVRGASLDDVLREGAVSVDRAVRIILDSASALAHAHKRGVIHRDIKPANIMLDEEDRVIVTDFGISKAVAQDTKFTATGQMIGTPTYMSPEQAKGEPEIDGRADQYSLGVVAYNLLSGQLPFDAESLHGLLLKQLYEDPKPLPEIRADIPEGLANAIHRALAKEKDERFSSMEEFAEAVRTGASGGKVAAPVFDRPTQLTQETIALRTRRRSTALVGAAVALAAVVGIGGWFALSGGSGPEAATDAPPEVASAEPTDLATGPAADTTATVEAPPPASEERPPSPPARDPEPTPTRTAPVPAPAEPATVEQNGFLTVGTTPWGLVAIDGVEIRNSPLVSHQISVGEHVVTVTRMGYQTVVDTVVITAGNHTRIQHVLLPDTTAFRR